MQGYAGTPTDVNALTYDANVDIGAAGVQFPRLQRFYVAVDSRADPFTNQPAEGQVPAERLDQRPDAAVRAPPDDEGQRRTSAARRAGRRSSVRRRPALARRQLQQRARRRVRLRPGHRAGPLRHPDRGAEAEGRHDEGDRGGVRLPGGEEHQHRRERHLPQHGLPAVEADGRERADGDLGRAARPRLRVQERPSRGRRRLDEEDQERHVHTTASTASVSTRPAPAVCTPSAWNTKGLKKGSRQLLATVTDASGRHAAAGRELKICRVAVVTGASSGIGAELVRALQARGTLVVGLSRRPSRGRRARGVRRLRSRRGRSDGRPRARAPPAHRPARQQRRGRRALQLPRSRAGDDRAGDARQLPRHRVVDARVPAGPRRGIARRQPRLGRGHRRRRPVLGVEARTARVLALDRRRACAAGNHGAHRQPGLRRDGGLPAARALPRRASTGSSSIHRSSSSACSGAVDKGKREIVVPRWYRPAAWAQALAPGRGR